MPSSGDSGRIAGLDPVFLARFEGFRAAAKQRLGITVRIVSGFRTRAEQEVLWKGYQRRLAGIPGNEHFNLAARPGTSRHESGLAIDMDPDVAEQPRLRPLLAEFGLTLPVPGEPWHVEMPRGAAPLPTPTPPPATPTEDDDMYVRYNLTGQSPSVWLVHATGRFAPPADLLAAIERSGAIKATVTCDEAASKQFIDGHPG